MLNYSTNLAALELTTPTSSAGACYLLVCASLQLISCVPNGYLEISISWSVIIRLVSTYQKITSTNWSLAYAE